jgi:acyl-CoA synthetase (AMP-forming)/AMP-acid ligase II
VDASTDRGEVEDVFGEHRIGVSAVEGFLHVGVTHVGPTDRDGIAVVAVGRPSTRWGTKVVALVQLADGAHAEADEIVAEAARHIARYKLPKEIVFCTRVQRSPSGKADYPWAKAQVTARL